MRKKDNVCSLLYVELKKKKSHRYKEIDDCQKWERGYGVREIGEGGQKVKKNKKIWLFTY